MSLRGPPPLPSAATANNNARHHADDSEEGCLPLRRWSVRRVLLVIGGGVALLWMLAIAYGIAAVDDIDDRPWRRSAIADYDEVGCNGHPLDERIADLQRILRSVRKEVSESARKLEEANAAYEKISKDIPQKQSELAQLGAEIESARSLLRDLHDRRNVRVRLPNVPLLPASPTVHSTSAREQALTMEDVTDVSRCSISSPLRVFLYPSTSSPPSPLRKALEESPYIVSEPSSACLFIAVLDGALPSSALAHWGNDGSNHVVIGGEAAGANSTAPALLFTGRALLVREHFNGHSPFHPRLHYAAHWSSLQREKCDDWSTLPQLLPYSRKRLLLVLARTAWPTAAADERALLESGAASEDSIEFLACDREPRACAEAAKIKVSMSSALFTALVPSPEFQHDLLRCLRSGSIPVILSTGQPLPFEDTVDWSLIALRVPLARLPELHFILRTIPMADALEMRRRARAVLENYLGTADALARTLLTSLSTRLGLPPRGPKPSIASPLFNATSFVAGIQTPVNLPPQLDDEYLGPLEAPFESPSHLHNFSALSLYSSKRWNEEYAPGASLEYRIDAVDMPGDSEFEEDSAVGFRNIEPGSGNEFSLALGGNRAREQFTVVMLTYNRDAILAASLERLHKCPYLNKVIVIWNNIEREPIGAWPRLHVPVEFIRAELNSLNNRFVPWDRIETEAVLSLDDDIDLKQHEIVFAFRVWREERSRIVGFPARYHARFGSELFYNSNHTCQMSMILTGAAFIHKSYFHAYTHEMPRAIREHVDKVTNCEDIAMNFLVSHRSRRPPLKTTSKWTLKCPTCTDSLWSDASHFEERHECIRLFTRIYGYNPLKYSQYRADSILFKTRLPADKQKCFRYV